jgi:hypothetical protein
MAASSQAEGEALALDPYLYPENQKRQKSLVNQYGMAERVDSNPRSHYAHYFRQPRRLAEAHFEVEVIESCWPLRR